MGDLSAVLVAAIHHDAAIHATHFGDTCDPGDAPKEFTVSCLCIAILFPFSILTITAMIHVTLAMLSKTWLLFVMFAEAG